MIERLRKRFIRIATLAVAGVLLLLCVTVNAANYVSVDRQLTQMLRMICDNQGTVPHFPPGGGKPGQKPDGPFTPETPYSTRYFVLRYDGDGDLEQADLTHIAAVSEGDTAQYLTAALRHGAGSATRRDINTTSSTRAPTAGWPSSLTAIRSCTRS